ncbi:hypothetical protein Dsin_010205 [Dipteronia sinensis]|uniref:AP2/ERF domain-containing protein n=1 Tax=Dipteronia sinensis TaxID=43782 RepID=A0AAE0EE74_9ROSI|nr:hypothetical protein Dsin_010205 [Dipteronia sinensis]
MEMNTNNAAVSEIISPGRRRLCIAEGGSMETVCVKRRRRDPSAVSNNNQQQQLQVDQTTTTATTVKRSSKFRGVSRHRWTGRYEAHLWDKGSWNPTQRKKGKQGAYDEEESAARAYDLAALKYWGTSTFTNFPVSDYEKEIDIMKSVTKEEYLASLRRRSSGFSRGVSKYRGVARHHHNGRWEARIGRVFGNKYLYLGTYSTQEEAAHAYDIAAIEYRGINAVTNFDLSTYIRWLKPVGGGANSAPDHPLVPSFQQPNSTLMEPHHQPMINHFTRDQTITDPSIFNLNPFVVEPVPLNSTTTRNQDMFQTKLSSSSSSNSSPTALSLLLRSSIFKELVEKNNLNDSNNKEAHDHNQDNNNNNNNTTNVSNAARVLVGNDNNEVGRMFY